jgi:hypothetical protein
MGASEFDSGMGVDDTDDDPQPAAKSAPRANVTPRRRVWEGVGFTWELR